VPRIERAAREAGPDCIVVDGPEPVSVEGVLTEGSSDAPPVTGGRAGALVVLRLARARCVDGLPRAGFVREVLVASTGMDLRPLVGRAVRLTGTTLAGTNDVGGPAVILLARDAERLPTADGP
jgi:hypothetical protein